MTYDQVKAEVLRGVMVFPCELCFRPVVLPVRVVSKARDNVFDVRCGKCLGGGMKVSWYGPKGERRGCYVPDAVVDL